MNTIPRDRLSEAYALTVGWGQGPLGHAPEPPGANVIQLKVSLTVCPPRSPRGLLFNY